MKSSAISLIFHKDSSDTLINLIDSPGHVDFSSEVSTAVRLCDGAIVLVDVVEGVCPQTHAVLRQAWLENIKPVLVLNKIDRLIMELKMSPLEAHIHLQQLLEQVNAITGELFMSHFIENSATKTDSVVEDTGNTGDKVFDWSSGLEETDDSNLYFSPDQGNVIFASAIDGWGFGINHFAQLYAAKLGVNAEILQKTLWGDFYLEAKTKRIKKGAQQKGKKPLFVNFILENLWAVYEAAFVNRDKEMVEKIVKSLNLKIPARDTRHGDPRVLLQALCSEWLPLSKAVLAMAVDKLPTPLEIPADKAEQLLCSRGQSFQQLPAETQNLKRAFLSCSGADQEPVVIYVSKLFPVERKHLPENKQRPLTHEEIALRRELARKRHAERRVRFADENSEEEKCDKVKDDKAECGTSGLIMSRGDSSDSLTDQVFVAFARVYSGTVRKGQKLYVLGPKHDPAKAINKDETAFKYISEVTVEDLYVFMGRELEALDKIPAGNILGIGGLEDHILKSATISDTLVCPAFSEMFFEASPIVRVAVEPTNAADMAKLSTGLRLLNQADPSVEILIQESGEQVVIAAGEVHLQKCLDDLTQRFAKIEVNVSPPIVPFRETIIPIPKFDRLNEAIEGARPVVAPSFRDDSGDESDEEVLEPGLIAIQTASRLCSLKIRAVPLPSEVTKLLDSKSDLIKLIDQCSSQKISENLKPSEKLNPQVKEEIVKLKRDLTEAFERCPEEDQPVWEDIVEKIWCFGPRRNGANVLVNKIPEYNRPSIWTCTGDDDADKSSTKYKLRDFDYSVVAGFQMATLAGPLCEEPMYGVCFVVESWERHFRATSLKQRRSESENISQLEEESGDVTRIMPPGDVAHIMPPGDVARIMPPGDVARIMPPGEVARIMPPGEVARIMPPGEVARIMPPGEVARIMPPGEVARIRPLSFEEEHGNAEIRGATHNCTGDKSTDSVLSEITISHESDPIRQVRLCFNDGTSDEMTTDESVPNSPPTFFNPRDALMQGSFSGQLMSAVKKGCRRAFESQPQRLMWAMYTCVVQATAEVLGKMYGVLSKRHGKILNEELREGSSIFNIDAVLPVVESFGFAEEIRKKTSGLASPQLKFSHWEVIEIDPFWVPTTEEEYMHFGEKADSENVARKYMNSVRRRKGLHTDDKLVQFAEKQRTLKKNK